MLLWISRVAGGVPYTMAVFVLGVALAMLDHATHAANDLAWRMLLRMAAWVHRHATAAVESEGLDNWQGVLNTEALCEALHMMPIVLFPIPIPRSASNVYRSKVQERWWP